MRKTNLDVTSAAFLQFLSAFIIAVDTRSSVARWDVDSPVEVSRGNDVTVTCTVRGLSILDVVRVVRRSQWRNCDEWGTPTISDNGDLKEPYSSLGRYRVYYSFSDGTATTRLNYRAIEGRDAGIIGCGRLGSDENLFSYINLTVIVPVSDLYLTTTGPNGTLIPLPNGTAVTLQESSTFPSSSSSVPGISCIAVADGSCDDVSLRSVHLALDGRQDVDPSDVIRSVDIQPSYRTSSSVFDLPDCRTTLTLVYPVTGLLDGRMIECLDGKSRRSMARVRVQYAPIVSCTQYVVKVTVGKATTLTCDVRSNPMSVVKWNCCDDRRQLGDVIFSERNLIVFNKTISNTHTQTTMVVNAVDESHLGEHIVTASNSQGSTSVAVTLIDEELIDDAAPRDLESIIQPDSAKLSQAETDTGDLQRASTSAARSLYISNAFVFPLLVAHSFARWTMKRPHALQSSC